MHCRMIHHKYTILEKIGSGSFGTIYKGQNIRTKEYVAIKAEPISSELKLLLNETKVYNYLAGCTGIPTLKWFGKDNTHYYMVINLLGQSLQSLMQQHGKFSLDFLLNIGIQIVLLLKTIHGKGIVHRDIKPDNFLFKEESLYLIDFGLCKPYMDCNHVHIPMKKTSNVIGSMNFCSLSSHNRQELGRKDDFESLGYMLLYFYSGCLPWSNDALEETIASKKRNVIHQKDIWPPVLLDYMTHVRNMTFHEEPNYFYIIQQFQQFQ